MDQVKAASMLPQNRMSDSAQTTVRPSLGAAALVEAWDVGLGRGAGDVGLGMWGWGCGRGTRGWEKWGYIWLYLRRARADNE